MIKNSAPEKWEYKEHTRVKHEILKKYLHPWIVKLGFFHRRILFIDGFAGRGEYIDENTGKVVALGSPIIALEVANSLLELAQKKNRRPYFDEFVCIYVEKDNDNYKNLKSVISREKKNLKFNKKLIVDVINDEFSNVINEVYESVGTRIAPSFFFIDPFGIGGVPFEIIKKILSLPRTEIFFTFMTNAINRFLSVPSVKKILNELYPTDEWRQIYRIPDWKKRDQSLKDLYIKSLREEAKVKYPWAFRVCMSERRRTLYYFIHSTNHFDGLKIMKDIMKKQGASGTFAYLGPEEVKYRKQIMLFDDDIASLKKYLLDRFKGKRKTFIEILEETYMDTQFVDTQLNEALKELEDKDKKIKIEKKGKRGGIKNSEIIFPKNNPVQTSMLTTEQDLIIRIKPKIKIHYKEYSLLDGKKRKLVSKVNDGSIITRFDKTTLPIKRTDVVCPHFLELKWAYGCPYDCSWCYLKGTFRFRPDGISPVVKPYDKIKIHVKSFLEEVEEPEILNTGEIADSLMNENDKAPFSKLIIPLFETQNRHKVLFLTKSYNIKNILEMESHNQVIISFSLNAIPVAGRWEKAPNVLKRIKAAKKVFDAGYEVRIRIDPMVPVKNWQKYYLQLLELIFKNFKPERITLGSLRGLQSTINGCADKTWVKYLKESSNWGKKIDFKTRYEMYSTLIQKIQSTYKFENIALCKETIQMWDTLKMNYKKIKCNCIW